MRCGAASTRWRSGRSASRLRTGIKTAFWATTTCPIRSLWTAKSRANVSVNRTDFVLDGEKKRLIQLGTVMTDERCRSRGMIRRLMAEVERDCAGKADGVYLFANDTVLDFYPKFGFRRAAEVRYARALEPGGAASAVRVPMRDRDAWDRLTAVIRSSAPCGRFSLCGNTGLPLFYVSKFMQDCVYRVAPEAYAVAELEDGVLHLHAVYAEKQPAPEAVARAFGGAVRRVQLGFTPLDTTGWEAETVHEDDTTLFVRGAGFRDFERRGLMFPVLAHA